METKVEPLPRFKPFQLVDNVIINRLNLNLLSYVNSFDADKKAAQVLREKILEQSFSVFKVMFKKGNSELVREKLLKELLRKRDAKEGGNK